jgi:hypothetical protein
MRFVRATEVSRNSHSRSFEFFTSVGWDLPVGHGTKFVCCKNLSGVNESADTHLRLLLVPQMLSPS